MSDFNTLRTQLNDAKADYDAAQDALIEAQEQLALLETSISTEARKKSLTDAKNTPHTDGRSLQQIEQSIADLKDDLTQKRTALLVAQHEFADLGQPQTLIEELDDAYPFLLTPVRIEYRFRKERALLPITNNQGSIVGFTQGDKYELWVRFFPDDIHADTHEPRLTPDELQSGKIYWTQIWDTYLEVYDGGGPLTNTEKEFVENQKFGSWTVLHRSYGPGRAAWIAQQTKPTNWPSDLHDFASMTSTPSFPSPTLKANPWSRAPRANLLPDRFVVRVYTGNSYQEKVGQPISYPLIIGPDPQQADTSFEEVNGKLKVDPEMEWMVDFDKAVESGMGLKMPITATEYANGFDKLLVLGVQLSEDEQEGKAAVEHHLNQLHYAPEDFSLVPQGTTTNNTEEGGAGFSSSIRNEAFTFKVEAGEALIDEQVGRPSIDKRDGEWLAEALGIEKSVLAHIGFSDHTDIREAIAMNQALSPATVRYFLEQMLYSELSVEFIEKIQRFFCEYVRSCGPLPAIRVGQQPYGILTTSAYSKMNWTGGNNDAVAIAIQNVLERIHQEWGQKLAEVKTVKENTGNWQENFMEILGLHPASVQYFSRYMLGPWLNWNIRRFYTKDDALVQSWWQQNIWDPGEDIRTNLGLFSNRPFMLDGFFLNDNIWLRGKLIDENPLSESDTLVKKYFSKNYLEWLGSNNLSNIWNQSNFGNDSDSNPNPVPKSLLYLLMRHAMLTACLDAAITILKGQINVTSTQQKEHLNIITGDGGCELTHYDILFWDQRLPIYDTAESILLSNLLTNSDLYQYESKAGQLLKFREGLDVLKSIPTARLERNLVDHLDLCTYKMSGWQTGLVNYRLDQMRFPSPGAARQKGLYSGAYGWLIDVRPGPARQNVASADIPDSFRTPTHAPLQGVQQVNIGGQGGPQISHQPTQFPAQKASEPLTYEPGNAGFLQAPSQAQAVGGAIMRETYLSKGGDSMEVNLSSARVRKALQIIQGIQNGQDLAALIGYRLERSIHDVSEQTPGVEMNHYIYQLREKFPLSANQLTPTGSSDEQAEANNVIHGLDFLDYLKSNAISDLAFGFTVAEESILQQIVDELNNILDALGDLFLSEGVYQAVLGNFERAGANLNALSEGKLPPSPQVIETPRTGITLTHRVGVLFDTDTTDSHWATIADTPRSLAQPYLNRWLSSVIDDPEQIRCKAIYQPANSNTETEVDIKLSDLGLQAIDFVSIMDEQLANDETELAQRIKEQVRIDYSLNDADTVSIDFNKRDGWGLSVKTFPEMVTLVSTLKKLIGEGRFLHPEDFVLSADEAPDSMAIDLSTFWTSIKTAYESFDSLLSSLANAITTVDSFTDPENDLTAPTAFDALRDELRKAARFGLEGSIPKSIAGTDEAIQDILVAQGNLVLGKMESQQQECQSELLTLSDTPPVGTITSAVLDQIVTAAITADALDAVDLVKRLLEAGRKLFGGFFHAVPLFRFSNADELELAVTASTTTLLQDVPPMGVEEWLQGAAKVRMPIQQLQQTALFSDTLNTTPANFDLQPIQLPYQENARWLGLPYMEAPDVFSDTLSLVMRLPANFDATDSSYKAGVFIDEWLEIIPSKEETTGIAFNYNEPDSEPPNVLLLAVPPAITGNWTWEDLMDTLNETLDLAQKRAVDPYLLEKPTGTNFNHFLPGLIAAISNRPDKMITLNFNDNN